MAVSRLLLVLVAVIAAGCAGLRPGQREDIVRWQAEAARMGHPEVRYENHLSPIGAMWLGFLPGGGFYVRPGLGVQSIVFWPLSFLWVPGKAYAGAEHYNYMQFRERILALRHEARTEISSPSRPHRVPVDSRRAMKQLRRLDKLWSAGRISEARYLQQRRAVLESMADQHWDQPATNPNR